MTEMPYTGGVILRNADGDKIGHIEVRGSGSGVQVSTVWGGFPVASSVLLDLFDDEQVEDLRAALGMALERKREIAGEMERRVSAGGPV